MNVGAMRKHKKTQGEAATPGFAIQILPDTDLGYAMLIAEDEEGHYEPVNYASSLGEAFEMLRKTFVIGSGSSKPTRTPAFAPGSTRSGRADSKARWWLRPSGSESR